MTSIWKRAGMIGGTIGAMAATLLLSAAPASASGDYSGLAYVKGGGTTFLDDWGDEGILSTSRHAYSNATCLWQKVLWAHGYLSWDNIDGVFGPATKTATINYQKKWGLTADGVVGKDTFNLAGWHGLRDFDGDSAVDTYLGNSGKTFILKRDGNNRYTFYDRSGNLRDAGYNYLTCS